MCGIAGFIDYDNENRAQILSYMGASLSHRGPDGYGEYLDSRIGMAHNRLAIIDVGESGAQPMFSSDRRFVVVFNGEIYNYLELRNELEYKGSKFLTQSDTEVIPESVRVWGISVAVEKFRGMFSFALYDFSCRKLYLARDRTGIKPLYYSSAGKSIFFASEQKAILKVPDISRKINPTAIHDILTLGYPVTPDTCWRDIRMFPPAHYAEIGHGEIVNPTRYWKWEFHPEKISFEDAIDKARSVLGNSLKYHMRSDVPVAAFLSGGIDSSLLVALLSKRIGSEPLSTFNVGFDEGIYDESSDAAHVAEKAGTRHYSIKMKSEEGDPGEFEKILSQYDEPYSDSSCLPTYSISREMRKHVKVVISGDGGDEIFAGYPRIGYASIISRLRYFPFKKLFAKVLNHSSFLVGEDFSRKSRNAIRMASVSDHEMMTLLHSYFSEEEKFASYAGDFAASINGIAPTWKRVSPYISNDPDPSKRLMGMEVSLVLHGDYLRKVDIASSANSLEVRVPFLDQEVMDFASSLPLNMKMKGSTTKYILRELARREISDRIADKKKWGFGIPFDTWCGKAMKEYLRELLFSNAADAGIWSLIKRSYGEALWRDFNNVESSSRLRTSRFQVYQRIFTMASIQIWFRRLNPQL
jgi:asparagine synthase (glutamine-hydrolysing)